ncbi:MAG: LytTR family transcriptional regulator [Bacteroidetes bacterium]|nr:LytTR family transcriptional regulator [Bacteroidota bacterium]
MSKFLINDSSFIENRNLYEEYLASKNNSMLNLRYLISICISHINPFTFSNVTIPEYLNAIEECLNTDDNKSISLLYLYLHKHFESLGDFKQSIYYFEKYSKFALIDLKYKEASSLIEDKIIFELNKQLNYSDKNLTNINTAKNTIYHNYISAAISQNFAKEINTSNYEIISRLIVEQFKTQVSICTNHGIKFLETNNIQVLESDGNYTILYDKDAKRHISSKPLAYYEKQLDPKSFLRTHRSYIININYIVHFFPGRVGKIELTNGQIIEVSARKMAEVRKRIWN